MCCANGNRGRRALEEPGAVVINCISNSDNSANAVVTIHPMAVDGDSTGAEMIAAPELAGSKIPDVLSLAWCPGPLCRSQPQPAQGAE